MFLNWVQGPYNGKIDVQTVDIGENKFSKSTISFIIM